MLNRHAIVLFLGLASLTLLREAQAVAYGALGAALFAVVLGLLLDPGQPGIRQELSHLIQGTGVVLLGYQSVRELASASPHLALAELGIAMGVLGVLLELRLTYRSLRLGVGLHAAGDAVFLAGGLWTALTRSRTPSTLGWVFIAIAGSLSLYAALSNLILQLRRLRNAQAGWRYCVLGSEGEGLRVKTPGGTLWIRWQHVQAVRRLDARHLLLVLPSPLPAELVAAALPVEELRVGEAPVSPDVPPERYGFVLHEQELGSTLSEAEAQLRSYVPAL